MLDLFGTAEKRFFYERWRADVGSSPRLTTRRAANGITIVTCSASTHAMNPFLYKRLAFDGRARLRRTPTGTPMQASAPYAAWRIPGIPIRALQQNSVF
jgi:hypothetical protein